MNEEVMKKIGPKVVALRKAYQDWATEVYCGCTTNAEAIALVSLELHMMFENFVSSASKVAEKQEQAEKGKQDEKEAAE